LGGRSRENLSFLLLVSFYLGYKGLAALSGVVFALGAFDPRFTVLALPLFLFYNKGKLKSAFVTMVMTIVISNFMVFYPGTVQGFVNMVLGSGSTTPFYTPSWIPLAMLVSLILVNGRQMIETLKLRRVSNN